MHIDGKGMLWEWQRSIALWAGHVIDILVKLKRPIKRVLKPSDQFKIEYFPQCLHGFFVVILCARAEYLCEVWSPVLIGSQPLAAIGRDVSPEE